MPHFHPRSLEDRPDGPNIDNAGSNPVEGTMSTYNRFANCHNHFQGKYKKVLCVCSAGLLRSPTAAFVLSTEFDCNTRAAGLVEEFALIVVDRVLLEWADEIVCMNQDHALEIQGMLEEPKPVVSLDIPDSFRYRDPELCRLIREGYQKYLSQPSLVDQVSASEAE